MNEARAVVQETERGLRLAPPPFRVRARAIASAVGQASIGVAALAIVCRGVFLNWGPGWAHIAAGLPVLVGFIVHEWRSEFGRRERG